MKASPDVAVQLDCTLTSAPSATLSIVRTAAALKDSGEPVTPESLPMITPVAMFCILAYVTASLAILTVVTAPSASFVAVTPPSFTLNESPVNVKDDPSAV